MDIFKKTVLCVLVSTSLIACGGGGSDDSATNNSGTTGTTYKIESGAFQKGPFVAGTTVTIQELGDDLKPTGVTYTAVTDDTGRFNATNIKSRYVEVFADGFYFDELTNLKSKAAVTLRAILDLTASASKPSINTLTTMQTERLRAVKANGKTFQEAEADSRNAVLGVFGLPANAITRLDSINLTGTSAGDESLLRATVALLQVASNQSSSVEAELTQLVAKLASDLKDDGQANGTAKDFVLPLQMAQSKVNMDLMRLQLQEYLQGKVNTLTTTDEVAKAAAAYIATKTAFGRFLNFSSARFVQNTSTDVNPVNVACNSLPNAPTFSILKNASTANPYNGTLSFPVDCPHGEYVTKSGGQIISTLNSLPNSLSVTKVMNFTVGLPATGFYPTLNGSMEHTFQNNLNNDVYKGSIKLEKNGLVTIFSFPDGLFSAIASGTAEHGATYTTATGKMSVIGGSAFNCIADGVFSYQATLPLVNMQGAESGFASGTLKISRGTVESGTVTFNADGSINVKTPTESEKTISKSVFASYCGRGEINDWSQRKSTN